MFCSIISATIRGIEARKVDVEVDISQGLPVFDMVGLLNSEIKESRERVRSGLKNTGYHLPPNRITVSLTPANERKEGTGFDLAITAGLLVSMGVINKKSVENTMIAGELSLDGQLRKIKGILPMIIMAKETNIKRFIMPYENVKEALAIDGVEIVGVKNIKDFVELTNSGYKNYQIEINKDEETAVKYPDFLDVCGQENAVRAALIAAAGAHHLLLVGPPGAGKSMIAQRIPSILPPMTLGESVEVTKIYSVFGDKSMNGLIRARPYRTPHHNITPQALVGGGYKAKCGEVTLAHRGVLFLDEFAEFSRKTVDYIRQPLENGEINVSRNDANYNYPSEFMLVAATNPCRCGYYPDRNKCMCTDADVKKYMEKLKGPVLDRIDLCVSMYKTDIKEINKGGKYSSNELLKKVVKAREVQAERYKDFLKHENGQAESVNDQKIILYNSKMNSKMLQRYCRLGEKEEKLLDLIYEKYDLSTRGYYKIIKVARTIADLEDSTDIKEEHILQAVAYRIDNLWC